MSTKGATLLEMKMRAQAREQEEKAKAARKRNILVLVLDFLCKAGYTEAMDKLQTESSVSLARWVAADNLDLNTVFQEFEAFYEVRPWTVSAACCRMRRIRTRAHCSCALFFLWCR
jgi:katanin p60 ATPase-containing subunit A1